MKNVNKTNVHVSFSCFLMSDYHGAVYKSGRQLGEPRLLNKPFMPGNVLGGIPKLQHFVSCQGSVYVYTQLPH